MSPIVTYSASRLGTYRFSLSTQAVLSFCSGFDVLGLGTPSRHAGLLFVTLPLKVAHKDSLVQTANPQRPCR